MPYYDWKNTKTGEIVSVQRPIDEHSLPPTTEEGAWIRVFSFGVGRVEGGGATPSRTSVVKK